MQANHKGRVDGARRRREPPSYALRVWLRPNPPLLLQMFLSLSLSFPRYNSPFPPLLIIFWALWEYERIDQKLDWKFSSSAHFHHGLSTSGRGFVSATIDSSYIADHSCQCCDPHVLRLCGSIVWFHYLTVTDVTLIYPLLLLCVLWLHNLGEAVSRCWLRCWVCG